jgi:hypothetical protein
MNPDMHEGTNVSAYAFGRWAYALAPAIFGALLASGCMKAQAKTVPQVPLDMPAPPPRVVEVSDPASPPIVPFPEEPVRSTPPLPRPTPPQRTESRPPEPTPDIPADTAKTDEVPKPPASPTLQTVPAQQETEAERKIRAILGQAANDLNRINVQSLNADARQQFETARGFVRQAEDALRAKNLVFASNLAEKASALAAQLVGR